MRRGMANVYRLGLKELRSLRADPVLVFLILYTFTFAIYAVTAKMVSASNPDDVR